MGKIYVLIILVFIFLLFCVIVLTFRAMSRPIHVKLDSGSVLRITQDKEGHTDVRIDVDSDPSRSGSEYLSTEEKMNGVIFEDDVLDLAFWRKFLDAENLPYEERESMADRLVKYGFMSEDKRKSFAMLAPEFTQRAPETFNPASPVPTSAPSGSDWEYDMFPTH